MNKEERSATQKLLRQIQAMSIYQKRSFVRWRDSLLGKTKGLAQSVWAATQREGRETREALKVLSKMLQQQPVSEAEKQLLVEQSKDIVRILPLVAIQGIPVPVPITPLLIALATKYKLPLLPEDQSALISQIEQDEALKQFMRAANDTTNPENAPDKKNTPEGD